MVLSVRRPAVAGYFYPAAPMALQQQIDALVTEPPLRVAATAVVVPHGSYARCGAILGSVFARIRIPRRCIIVGPSHTGSWLAWSLMGSGLYRTPLGDAPVDQPLARALRAACPFLPAEEWPQEGEHAIEVVVPFLQRLGPANVSIVPVVVGSDDTAQISQFTSALTEAVRSAGESVLLIASTDLTHFQPRAQAAAQDREAIQQLCALDDAALLQAAQDQGRAMCGYGAAAAVIGAAKLLGAQQGTLTRYATSAEADGDPDSVVGYAGIVIE